MPKLFGKKHRHFVVWPPKSWGASSAEACWNSLWNTTVKRYGSRDAVMEVLQLTAWGRGFRAKARYPCVDGPLGSRAMLQNRRRVRVRSCVRPCGAVEMTAAQ